MLAHVTYYRKRGKHSSAIARARRKGKRKLARRRMEFEARNTFGIEPIPGEFTFDLRVRCMRAARYTPDP